MHVAMSPRQKLVRSTRVPIRQIRRFHTVHCSAATETPPLAGKRVFVAGATGGTGKYIVQRLVNDGAQVLALVRDIERGKGLLPSECELILGDVDQLMGLPSKMDSCDAVVCATGSSSPTNPLGPFTVDYGGTCNLVAAAEKAGATKFVLVSSIGADDLLFPLNLFWGVLFWKKRAEEALQRSGLDYTVVRPGGLAEKGDDRGKGNVVMNGPGHFGLPPKEVPGSIWRSAVADICVEAITLPEASMKVVEVIAKPDAPEASVQSLFASVQ